MKREVIDFKYFVSGKYSEEFKKETKQRRDDYWFFAWSGTALVLMVCAV